MANYCVINNNDKIVDNRIVWDGISSWTPPANHTAIKSDIGQIGDKYQNSKFYYWNEETQKWIERT
ncbi:hypothetical protein FJZ33_00220 [Candidatus Poribacteria bacterium]|nr:hypothetical protein [Candidatus Poribacteria bacterium]